MEARGGATCEELQPAVIVMDVNMPHMDGVQATRLIKEEQPAVIIIGLSVNKAVSVREAMLRAGASEYLNKENVGAHLYTIGTSCMPARLAC